MRRRLTTAGADSQQRRRGQTGHQRSARAWPPSPPPGPADNARPGRAGRPALPRRYCPQRCHARASRSAPASGSGWPHPRAQRPAVTRPSSRLRRRGSSRSQPVLAGGVGGPGIPGSPQMPSLSWQELAGDLRLARHFCDQILITAWKGASGRASCPGCDPSSGQIWEAPGWCQGRCGPAQDSARNPVGQRVSLACAGHHSGRGLAHLAMAPQVTFDSRDSTLFPTATCGPALPWAGY